MSTTTNIGLFKHDNPATNTDQFNVDKALNQNWDKTDNAIGKDRERITTLETDNTTNKQDITEIKAKDTEQDKYISELEAENTRLRQDLNGLPKGQASGESIDLTGSAEMRCDLKISGNSKQETRSGKNKLNIIIPTQTKNGITVTNNKNGSCTINGTSTESGTTYFNLNIKLDDETYAFDIDNEIYSITTGVTLPTGIFMVLRTIETNNSFIEIREGEKEKNNITVKTKGKGQVYIGISAGATINNLTLYPMIVKGKECGDFEQYGASPSPDYPSEVECVTGDVNLTICNKNLAKINETDWTLTDNNTIKNKAKNDGSVLTEFYLKKGQTIKISLKLMSKPTGDTTLSSYINGKDTNKISNFTHINIYDIEKIYTKTYTATEDCTISFKLWGNSNSDIFEFQFWAELDNVTEYLPHKSQTYTIPTQQPFRAIGDIRDEFVKVDDKCFERHYISRRILDGTEEIGILWNTGKYGYNIKISDMKMTSSLSDKSMILSNMHKVYTQDDLFNLKYPANGISCRANKNEIIIRDDNITTLSDLITNLSTNKPYVDYILETPLDIECTEEQSIILDQIENEVKTYKNITHMYSTDKISSYKEVTYKQDLETRLNNIEQAILSQGGNI